MIGPFRGQYSWLSNFYPAEVKLGGIIYPTVEHAYQAAKTIIPEERELIRAATTPREAKQRGKWVTLHKDQNQRKILIMTQLITQKFGSHSGLRQKLIATAEEPLVEINDWGDTFWGWSTKHQAGENHLGKILMSVREIWV